MCGVVGKINYDGQPVSFSTLKGMTDAISHRGPDGEGHWFEKQVGFGHRRLAIIDLSEEASQPMVSSDQRYILTYNGEIYNFKELRCELEKKGYLFRSSSDTEVVLYSLIEWKEKALMKFNGMFALSFWDKKKGNLLLARDRYGIKPLYYSEEGNSLSFASEQKAILSQPNFDRTINRKALLEYFTFQNIFTDQTLIDGIKLLPAGYYGKIDLSKKNPQLKRTQYWGLSIIG